MATIEKCSVCGASAAVRWKPGTGRARFLVWVEYGVRNTHAAIHGRRTACRGQPWRKVGYTGMEQRRTEQTRKKVKDYG